MLDGAMARCGGAHSRNHARRVVRVQLGEGQEKMRLIATIIFIVQLLFIPGPQTVWVPSARYLGWEDYTASVPDDYYNQGCVIPHGMDVDTWLTGLEWPYPLEDHVWDCSKTSAYTEWAMENCGYEAEIVLIDLGPFGHAFVMIEIDGKWKAYEATAREWLPELMGQWPRLVFGDIRQLRRFGPHDTLGFGREWVWWQK